MKSKSKPSHLVKNLIINILNIELEKISNSQILLFLKFLIEVQTFLNKKIITQEESIAIDDLPQLTIISLSQIDELILEIYNIKIEETTEKEKLAYFQSLKSLQKFIYKIGSKYEKFIVSNLEKTDSEKLRDHLLLLKEDVKKLPSYKNSSNEKLKKLHKNITKIRTVVNQIITEIQLLTPVGEIVCTQSAPIPGIQLKKLTTPIYEINQAFSYSSEVNDFLLTQHAPFSQLVEYEEKSNRSPLISRLEASAIVMKNLFINNKNVNMGYYQAKARHINDMHIQLLPSQDLITPVANSFYDEIHDLLLVNAVAFVNSELNIKAFNINFNYTLGSLGDPQLDIYITYNAPELSANKYNANPFMIGFWSNSVISQDGTIVPLRLIKTVNVFLVNQDPRTSRGTTTTVQNQIPNS